jgi:hypothetical protein
MKDTLLSAFLTWLIIVLLSLILLGWIGGMLLFSIIDFLRGKRLKKRKQNEEKTKPLIIYYS